MLYLSASEQQPKDAVTEQPMQVYCRNNSVCRRQVLLSEFTTETIEQPSPLHDCCDVCQRTCSCEQCECTTLLYLLPEDIQEMETDTQLLFAMYSHNHWIQESGNNFMQNYAHIEKASVKMQQTILGRLFRFCDSHRTYR